MKKYVVLLVACVIVGLWIVNVALTTIPADKLWYPGGVGSSWVYKTPDGSKIEVTLNFVEFIDGVTYRLVQEKLPLVGSLWLAPHDPFLTFREDGQNRIVGYGKEMNKAFKDILLGIIIDRGPMLGKKVVEEQMQVDIFFEEWILLDGNAETWTVMELGAELRPEEEGEIKGACEIEGRFGPKISVEVKTKGGSKVFQAYELSYLFWYGVAGPLGKQEETQEMGSFLIVPDIGFIKVKTMSKVADLFEYQILPLEQSVLAGGKTVTTWASLKTR